MHDFPLARVFVQYNEANCMAQALALSGIKFRQELGENAMFEMPMHSSSYRALIRVCFTASDHSVLLLQNLPVPNTHSAGVSSSRPSLVSNGTNASIERCSWASVEPVQVGDWK